MADFDKRLDEALRLHQSGEIVDAESLYRELLSSDRECVLANHLLGVLLAQRGQYEEAHSYLKFVVTKEPTNVAFLLNYAVLLARMGELFESLNILSNAERLDARHPEVLRAKGEVFRELKQFQESFEYLARANEVRPDDAALLTSLARCNYDLGRSELAISLATRAAEVSPSYADAYVNRGFFLIEGGQAELALDDFNHAISIDSMHVEAHFNRAVALSSLGMEQAAKEAYDKVITLSPNHAQAFNNRGNLNRRHRRFAAARDDFLRSCELKSDYALPRNNLGLTLQELGSYLEAIHCYTEALSLQGDLTEAYVNRAACYRLLGEFESAISDYRHAANLDPLGHFCLGDKLHTESILCQWNEVAPNRSTIKGAVCVGQPVSAPFPILGFDDNPELQRTCAQLWVSLCLRRTAVVDFKELQRPANSKIHVAYISADFHDHATSYLIAQLLETHDRDRFEITGVTFGPDRDDSMRRRVEAAFDRFIDVRFESDIDIAQKLRLLGIDIAIDLKGYTQDSRPGIFAERCAPIQVSYLGYPGTMGASFIDYIVADPIVIAPSDVEYYTEKVIWLPHSYQVNDRKRPIAPTVYQRQALGLPEKGFVFCCFNASYKIQPETFDVWMRILQQVSGSVLWLLASHPVASENLRKEAVERGVDPSRLVFAQRMTLPEHLARHRVADLFIDTWPYNAHTTASDALWAGLPVLTLAGRSFASRVGASLLNAVGLPELVTYRVEDYESLAIALAHNPGRLARIRLKLEVNRLWEPLFDCERFTRYLESAYEQIAQRYRDGLFPDHLLVKESHIINSGTIPSEPIRSGDAQVVIQCEANTLEAMLGLQTRIEVMDVGAALINETPFYRRWLERGIAHLHAFEGDPRQIDLIRRTYQSRASVHEAFLFDGTAQTVFVASQASGMTSLLRPNEAVLRFFNGFEGFGQVLEQRSVQTRRLDEVLGVPRIDFLKMDVQGAELTILKHGRRVLEDCVAIQLEVSYVPLYDGQPSFGDVDVWLREAGFVPHCFLEIKRWSIAPTVRNNDIRIPFNQLLESDIVYIRDPLRVERWCAESVKKLILLAHEALGSVDLAVYLIRELERRDSYMGSLQQHYLQILNKR